MDIIYAGAKVTLIAAAGSDATYGLSGVSRPFQQQTTTLNQQTLTWLYNSEAEIARSKWSTRGWTYQEMMLSRRRLVFTEPHVFFQCGDLHVNGLGATAPFYFDIIISDWLKSGPFPSLDLSQILRGGIYRRIVEYFVRTLSFDSDALNAFKGIFSAVEYSNGLRMHNFYGIPIHSGKGHELAVFIIGLTWKAVVPVEPRTGDWPSWTCVAHKNGKIEFARQHAELWGTQERVVDVLWGKDDVKIEAIHCLLGNTEPWNVSDMPYDYEHFFPWITIDAFSADAQTSYPTGGTGDFRKTIAFDSCLGDEQPFIAICLGGLAHYVDSSFRFLLVRECRPGVFRRIGVAMYAFYHSDYSQVFGKSWTDRGDGRFFYKPPDDMFSKQSSWTKRSFQLE